MVGKNVMGRGLQKIDVVVDETIILKWIVRK